MSRHHTRSPHNPQKTSMQREQELIADVIDVAWERYRIQTIGDKLVRVYWETNDDLDWCVPTEYASDTHTFTGDDALEKAKRHCGVSRQGVGHLVTVWLDGEKI